MAETGYNGGVPEVSPDAAPPNRYNSNRATPDAFGANVGEGITDVGKGMQVAGKFFGQVAADNASNDYQDFATKILHGDPNKQTPGPDGTMQPDLGYLGLKGRAALDARPDVMKQLQDRAKEIRDGLQTPEQVAQFDNFSRRYRDGAAEKVGSHADTQANTWYAEVNKATGNLSMTEIANNYNDDDVYKHAQQDLRNAYVKNAQLAGGGDELTKQAIAKADSDALTARLSAMAVREPARALSELEKNKTIAGLQYDNLATAFRGRAEMQTGNTAGADALKSTYQKNPPQSAGYVKASLDQVAATYGVSGDYLTKVEQIESAGNPNAVSATGAKGSFQFTDGTWKQYGNGANPFDAKANADAAARFTRDNQIALTNTLGRPPTDAELYLAHQQGAGGAAALLANPNIPAADALASSFMKQAGGDFTKARSMAANAIAVNSGDPSASAGAFTAMWTSKFNGAATASATSRKADAFQTIMARTDLTDAERQHAITYVNQQISAQQVAMEADSKAKKEKNDATHAQISSDIISGKTNGIIDRIANSGLSGPEQQTLYNFAVGAGGVESTAAFGPGYTSALTRVLAPEDNPSRIVNPTDIIKMGPGGTGELSKRGVQELMTTMTTVKKQPDQAGIATVKAKQLKYYENQFGQDQSFLGPGVPPFKNPKGANLFNHEFVPAFEAAYSKWISEGKDPMVFLSDSKQIDGIMDRIYPPAQRNADSISADNGGAAAPDTTLPPIPEGVESGSWQTLMKDPPKKPDGSPISRAAWAASINLLREHATDPKYLKGFNDKFYLSGYTANDILKKVPYIEKRAANDEKPPEPNPNTVVPLPMGIRG